MKSIKLDDGVLTFDIKINGESKEWTVDLITAKLAAEDLERMHDLKQENGALIPTREFLENLAIAYEKLGALGCTPTAARSVWIVVATRFLKLADQNAQTLEVLLK